MMMLRPVARDRLVEELQVVQVGAEVLSDPAQVGQTDRLPSQAPLAAGDGRLEHHLEVDEQVLVGQGDAHRLGRDRAEHGLGLSRQRGARHAGAGPQTFSYTARSNVPSRSMAVWS
jgi:hypothetical protein